MHCCALQQSIKLKTLKEIRGTQAYVEIPLFWQWDITNAFEPKQGLPQIPQICPEDLAMVRMCWGF